MNNKTEHDCKQCWFGKRGCLEGIWLDPTDRTCFVEDAGQTAACCYSNEKPCWLVGTRKWHVECEEEETARELCDAINALTGVTIKGDPTGKVRELVEAAADMFVEGTKFIRIDKAAIDRLKNALAAFEVEE